MQLGLIRCRERFEPNQHFFVELFGEQCPEPSLQNLFGHFKQLCIEVGQPVEAGSKDEPARPQNTSSSLTARRRLSTVRRWYKGPSNRTASNMLSLRALRSVADAWFTRGDFPEALRLHLPAAVSRCQPNAINRKLSLEPV